MGPECNQHPGPKKQKVKTMNNDNQNINQEEILSHLSSFMGTTQYHRYSPLFPRFLLTDGALYLAKKCEAYWLFEMIGSYQTHPTIQNNRQLSQYQFWYLDVQDNQGVIRCEWDKGKTVLEQSILFTDFPLDTIRIWVSPYFPDQEALKQKRPYQVAMLPSEY